MRGPNTYEWRVCSARLLRHAKAVLEAPPLLGKAGHATLLITRTMRCRRPIAAHGRPPVSEVKHIKRRLSRRGRQRGFGLESVKGLAHDPTQAEVSYETSTRTPLASCFAAISGGGQSSLCPDIASCG